LSATVGQYFWVQTFKSGEMSRRAPFEYMRLPFAGYRGLADMGRVPVIWTYVGASIVIGSALYIAIASTSSPANAAAPPCPLGPLETPAP